MRKIHKEIQDEVKVSWCEG